MHEKSFCNILKVSKLPYKLPFARLLRPLLKPSQIIDKKSFQMEFQSIFHERSTCILTCGPTDLFC